MNDTDQTLAELNDTRADFPEESCVHELFEAQVRRTPDNVAAKFEGSQVTYAELNRRANQLAHRLLGLGVKPDDLVGISMERSLEMLVALLGVLKAGGAYVPVDPSLPADRLSFMLEDSGVSIVLTQARFRDDLPRSEGVRCVALDDQQEFPRGGPEEDQSVGVTAAHLAYMIYTSGSTGQPKGVLVEHRSLGNHLHWMQSALPLSPSDRALQKYSFSFDAATLEILYPLLAGACLILARPGGQMDTPYLLRLIRENEITAVDLVPSQLSQLLDEQEFRDAASLRQVVSGGEDLPRDLQDRFFESMKAALHNIYGPTETTIGSTYWTCAPNDAYERVPIGRPIFNTQAYVLDAQLAPLPVGVPGELYLGGVGVARGYLNRPDLTRERFLPDPFSGEPDARLYRTGDLVRLFPDGNIEFLGRVDHQVKVRGFRIELGEIESVLRGHSAVREVVVTAPGRVATEAEPEELSHRMASLDHDRAERLLSEIEGMDDMEIETLRAETSHGNGNGNRQTVTKSSAGFEVSLQIAEDVVTPPQPNQRNWVLRRVLEEFADDILHLDKTSRRFVTGSERVHIEKDWRTSEAQYDDSQLVIEGQQVMQDWERPLMRAMAEIATESRGDVLEVGFGMGISATFIQEFGVKSYTVIECNDGVIDEFHKWRRQYPESDVRLVYGKWQDVVEQLGTYDAIFFDTYPLDEAEFADHVINSVTFAEHFFATAAKCLRPGGVFTYYTNEIDSFSRRHQRRLFEHFSSFNLSIVKPLRPPEDNNYWWADSMVAVKAVK